jgi:hypothetical protein
MRFRLIQVSLYLHNSLHPISPISVRPFLNIKKYSVISTASLMARLSIKFVFTCFTLRTLYRSLVITHLKFNTEVTWVQSNFVPTWRGSPVCMSRVSKQTARVNTRGIRRLANCLMTQLLATSYVNQLWCTHWEPHSICSCKLCEIESSQTKQNSIMHAEFRYHISPC